MRCIWLKDLKFYLVSYLVTYPFLTLFWLHRGADSSPIAVILVQIIALGALSVLPPLFNEQEEDIHNGYRILAILPTTKRGVHLVKFLMPMLFSTVLFLSNLFIFSRLSMESEVIKISLNVQTLTALAILNLLALFYLVILKIGYTNFIRYASAATVVLALAAAPFTYILDINSSAMAEAFIRLMKEMDIKITLIAGLSLYFSLYLISLLMERK